MWSFDNSNTLSSWDKFFSFLNVSVPEKGFWLPLSPNNNPIGLGATTGLIDNPSSLASRDIFIKSFQKSGLSCLWVKLNTIGRPDFFDILLRTLNSVSGSGSFQSDTISINPAPASFIPKAISVSSSSCALNVGVYSPFKLLWLIVLDVENPKAPANIASFVIRRIFFKSSLLALSCLIARSPIT